MSFEWYGRILVENRALELLAVKSKRPADMTEAAFINRFNEELEAVSVKIPEGLAMTMTVHPKGYIRCELRLQRSKKRPLVGIEAAKQPF